MNSYYNVVLTTRDCLNTIERIKRAVIFHSFAPVLAITRFDVLMYIEKCKYTSTTVVFTKLQ